MKPIYHFIQSLLLLALAFSLFSGCSEDVMDRINKDGDHTTEVPAKYTLADVITSTAFNGIGGDFNTYFASYVEHEVGISNQLYRAETRQGEPSSSTTFNNIWNSIYATLKNARIVVARCSEGGPQEGNYTTKGIGEVMEALNTGLLADAWGDTPYSQAALPTLNNGQPQYLNPGVDSQEAIYKALMQLLDDAIADLPQGDQHTTGSAGVYDLVYQGDSEKWIKLAYGLKARYTMHRLYRATDKSAELGKVLDYIGKSFTSADEQAAFAIYDVTNLNPLFDFQWSRDYFAASESMSKKLIARKDPRADRAFIDKNWMQVTPDSTSFYMAPNGTPKPVQYTYNTSVFVFSQTAPTLLLSYHELLFLKAEALCRLNRNNEAKVVLKDAVIAAIANFENSVNAAMKAPLVVSNGGLTETTAAITPEKAAGYFDTEVAPLFDANPLKETMVQKYIAFWGASGESTECYNDIRRMKANGENFVELQNPNPFPLRCPYGDEDVNANPNVNKLQGDGKFVYSEPVWWAGGKR